MTTLHPDVLLDIRLSAVLARHRYATDAGPVLAELRNVAPDRRDLIVAAVGGWIGYYETPDTLPLTDSLRAEFDAGELQPWIDLGRGRRGMGHTNP